MKKIKMANNARVERGFDVSEGEQIILVKNCKNAIGVGWLEKLVSSSLGFLVQMKIIVDCETSVNIEKRQTVFFIVLQMYFRSNQKADSIIN